MVPYSWGLHRGFNFKSCPISKAPSASATISIEIDIMSNTSLKSWMVFNDWPALAHVINVEVWHIFPILACVIASTNRHLSDMLGCGILWLLELEYSALIRLLLFSGPLSKLALLLVLVLLHDLIIEELLWSLISRRLRYLELNPRLRSTLFRPYLRVFLDVQL